MKENLPSNKKIGIIGGGQLGYMLIESGTSMNLNFTTLDLKEAPCARLANKHLIGSINDAEDIRKLSEETDVITYEIEHIEIDELLQLEAEGKQIIPSAKTLSIIKNKGVQKMFYAEHQIPTAPFGIANNENEWDAILNQLEVDGTFVIKTCEGGYDGKGVQIAHISELQKYKFIYSEVAVVIEKAIEFTKELSVIVAKDLHGNMNHFEVVEMVFDPVLNLVDTLISPAEIEIEVKTKAISIAKKVVEKFDDAGIFAVELFLDAYNNIYVNEIAPRPHNSGHHTIESCVTSQFEQLNRILMGWKLGNTSQIRPAAMINLIGPQELNGAYKLVYTEELLNIDEVYIHLYGKTQTRPGRKLGHITLMAETIEALKEKITEVKKLISFV